MHNNDCDVIHDENPEDEVTIATRNQEYKEIIVLKLTRDFRFENIIYSAV